MTAGQGTQAEIVRKDLTADTWRDTVGSGESDAVLAHSNDREVSKIWEPNWEPRVMVFKATPGHCQRLSIQLIGQLSDTRHVPR